MAIQILDPNATGGKRDQTAQEQQELDELTKLTGRVAQIGRSFRSAVKNLIRYYVALDYGDSMGAAAADTYLTASSSRPRSRKVGTHRDILTAAFSLAVQEGDMTQAEADALLQQATGDPDATTVSPDAITPLINNWT
jgi:hypothetical protein